VKREKGRERSGRGEWTGKKGKGRRDGKGLEGESGRERSKKGEVTGKKWKGRKDGKEVEGRRGGKEGKREKVRERSGREEGAGLGLGQELYFKVTSSCTLNLTGSIGADGALNHAGYFCAVFC